MATAQISYRHSSSIPYDTILSGCMSHLCAKMMHKCSKCKMFILIYHVHL